MLGLWNGVGTMVLSKCLISATGDWHPSVSRGLHMCFKRQGISNPCSGSVVSSGVGAPRFQAPGPRTKL